MKFIDEAIVLVQSGNGGSGCVSFRREKFIERGGPDGGNGGKGGDVVFQTAPGKRTLYEFRFKRNLKAKNGASGQGKQKTGKQGKELIVDIPSGTLLTNYETGEIIKDFTRPCETYVVARGGRGGRGNAGFKSSTNKAPRFAQSGEPGESVTVKLELKLLADVGIIGLPNAGKSTLVSAISAAHPKTADYPFTTLTPSLGVVSTDWGESFVVADIPGLIEGAHMGQGLGIKFLKHIERTRILLHLIDISAIDSKNPLGAYNTIFHELKMYNKKLVRKPQLLVLNKTDLPFSSEAVSKFRSAFESKKIILISAITGEGIDRLKSQIVKMLELLDNG